MQFHVNFFKVTALCGLSLVVGAAFYADSSSSILAQTEAPAQAEVAPEDYHFYRGSTHAHTRYTESHGEQVKSNDPSKNGPPAEHFRRARAAGYDFYTTTDHSQEAPFEPTSPTNPAWLATKQQAMEATDADFVALVGYEHSENNGPDGKGHFNVINSAEYLDALEPGIGVREFYAWLKTQPKDTVVTFNHPKPDSYNSFDYRDDAVTEIITMLEVINSNKNIHYAAFVAALDKGWKVSPVAGNDNHGFYGITRHNSRTVVLATAKTRDAIVDAMKHRRTYASRDVNLQAKYTVNGQIMGSTLNAPSTLRFAIDISDPDVTDDANKITKIDIVTDGGVVVETHVPTPAHAVTWAPVLENTTGKYFFVRVWNASDNQPIAWLAPVWTGR